MSQKLYREEDINNIGKAIQEATGDHTTQYLVSEMADVIAHIRKAPDPKDVTFYDYDGTVLFTYTSQEAMQLTALPPLPDHTEDNLTCDGWNWTLEEIQDMADPFVDVGAVFHPTDNKTHVTVNVWTPYTFSLRLRSTVANGGTIDWGDGSELTTITNVGNIYDAIYTHQYTIAGIYDISIAAVGDSKIELGPNFMDSTSDFNTVCKNMTRSIILANNIRLYRNCFAAMSLLEILVLNDDIEILEQAICGGSSDNRYLKMLKAVIIPRELKLNGGYDFQPVMTPVVSVPPVLHLINNNSFSNLFNSYTGTHGMCTIALKHAQSSGIYDGDYSVNRTRLDVFYRATYIWASMAWSDRSRACSLKDVYLHRCVAIPFYDRNSANMADVTLHVPKIMYDDMMEWATWNGTASYVPDQFKGTVVPYESEWQTHYERVFSLKNDTVIAGVKITRWGEVIEDSGWDATDYLDVVGGESLYFVCPMNCTFNYYDSSKTRLGGNEFNYYPLDEENMGYKIELPDNARYIRFSGGNSYGRRLIQEVNVWRKLD